MFVCVSVCVCDHCPEVIKQNPLLTGRICVYVHITVVAVGVCVLVVMEGERDGLRTLRVHKLRGAW